MLYSSPLLLLPEGWLGRCLVVVEFSGQMILNVRALQGSYPIN